MPKVIISDTSCFIALHKIGELDILQKLYGKVFTTPEVANEFGKKLPLWILIRSAKNKSRQQILELQLDKGESSAIALAMEITDSTIILDDYKARKIAEKLKIQTTGTIGVLVKAKLRKIVPSIRPYLERFKKIDFYISSALEKQALKESGE